jgi:hypothetical protein
MEVARMGSDHAIQMSHVVAVHDRRARRAFEPGIAARAAARLRWRALDSELIAGADPGSSPQLAARAAHLTGRGVRAAVAGQLEHFLAAPANGRRWSVLPHRRAVAANAETIAELAKLLRGPVPLYAGGLAMLRALLTDGTGPAYTDTVGLTLALALGDVRRAIRG